MIRFSKHADEIRAAGTIECWCLHGAVGLSSDFRGLTKRLAEEKIGTRSVDLWRFLEDQALPIANFGAALNSEASGEVSRGNVRTLLGYSMGGRLALHALLAAKSPWQAAVIVSAHPGLENPAERESRRAADISWATKSLSGDWGKFLVDWSAQPVLGGKIPRDPQIEARMPARRREIAQSFIDWSLSAQSPLWERLPEISVPLLWIVGENDEKFHAIAERAVEKIPRATLAIAPAAGHRVPWEAEAWFAEQVASFLKLGQGRELRPAAP